MDKLGWDYYDVCYKRCGAEIDEQPGENDQPSVVELLMLSR